MFHVFKSFLVVYKQICYCCFPKRMWVWSINKRVNSSLLTLPRYLTCHFGAIIETIDHYSFFFLHFSPQNTESASFSRELAINTELTSQLSCGWLFFNTSAAHVQNTLSARRSGNVSALTIQSEACWIVDGLIGTPGNMFITPNLNNQWERRSRAADDAAKQWKGSRYLAGT